MSYPMLDDCCKTLECRFREAWPPSEWCNSHIVLAVSAGPDSMALLRLALSVKSSHGGNGAVFVAHYNHVVRGAAADADQAWLEDQCGQLGVRCISGRANWVELSSGQGAGWEAAARAARYDFLRHTAEQLGARFVAVAHTADDQVETILHRILRGTGLDGLSGIPWRRPLSSSVTLIRPLLDSRRNELLAYLNAQGQDYRLDESNRDLCRTRNRLRLELLPLLRKQFNAGVDDALLRLAGQARDVQGLVHQLAEEISEQCLSMDDSNASEKSRVRVRIDSRCLAGHPQHLVREVCRYAWQRANWPLQSMGFEFWQQLAELVSGQRRTPVNLPNNIRAHRENDEVVLEKLDRYDRNHPMC